MHTITCIGRDGISRQFVFGEPEEDITHEVDDEIRSLDIFVKTGPDATHVFSLSLREKPDGEYQIVAIDHNRHPDYMAKGIPDALLPYLSKMLATRICSSRTLVRGTGEFRTVDATKMWDRLVQKGLATFYAVEDVYRTV